MWCTEEAGETAGPDEGGSGSRAQSRGPALGQGSRRLQQGARAPLCPAPPAVCWRPPWGRSVEAVPGPPGGLRAAGEGGQGVSSLRVLPVSSPPSRSSASPPCRPGRDKACSCSLALGAPARPGPPHTLPSPLQTPLALQTRASSVALSSWGCPTRKSFPQHVVCVFWKVSSSVILHTFAHAHLPRSAGLGPGAHAGHRWRARGLRTAGPDRSPPRGWSSAASGAWPVARAPGSALRQRSEARGLSGLWQAPVSPALRPSARARGLGAASARRVGSRGSSAVRQAVRRRTPA